MKIGIMKSALLAVCAGIAFAHTAVQAQDSVLVVEVPGGLRLEMVWVEGGTFVMGSNNADGVKRKYETTGPEHRVRLDGYYICRHEVTQALWLSVMGENPSKFAGGDSLPVEQVSWTDATQFAALLSQQTGRRFRLPTEAEWEYAARGGIHADGKPYPGCDRRGLDEAAWYCVNSGNHTHPVGRLAPNALGLYDMGGNVAEWCSDWMAAYEAVECDNPLGARDGESRVVRGGHWGSISAGCAVFDRGWYVPTGKTEYYGLRLVMDPPADDETMDEN